MADPALPPLSGVVPILHTCWRDDGLLDAESVGRQIEWVIAQGVGGCGIALASDILRMTKAERIGFFRLVAGLVKGRVPLVMSVGAETAEQAMAFAAAAKAAGAAAVMAIPPRSKHIPPEEMHTYFTFIHDAAELPLIIQDASGYVGRPMTVEFQASLAVLHGWDRIWFKPEADPVGPVIARLRELSGGKAVIFEGSGGAQLVANHAHGITGTMPGCDLLDGIVGMWKALAAGDAAAADRLGAPVAALARLEGGHGLDGYLAIERHLMKKRGLFASDRMRDPGDWKPDPALLAEVDHEYRRLREAVGV